MPAQASMGAFVRPIFHPSIFSKASELAFAHALAIALMRRTQLMIMHAGRGSIGDWAHFPPVRKILERWEVLDPGTSRSECDRAHRTRRAVSGLSRTRYLTSQVTEQAAFNS